MTSRELRALIALFVLTLPAVTPRLYSSDEVQYYSYLRSIWFDRDVSFDNEYRALYDSGVARTPGFEETFLQPVTPTGRRENFATIGAALLWSPFYAVADLLTRLSRASDRPADGYSRFYVAAVAYGSACYGFAALLLSIAASRRLTGAGLLAGLAVWIGTPLLFYMYAAPPFSHACSAFAVALFITVWLRVRERWTRRGLITLAATAALMTMVREQDVFYTIVVAADYAKHLAETSRTEWRATTDDRRRAAIRDTAVAIVAAAATFILVYSPQLLAYVSLNGRLGPSRLVARKMNWLSPHAAGVLGSPNHGLFAWTPLALLATVGLVMLWRASPRPPASAAAGPTDRRVALALIAMLGLQVYISGSVESWTVAGAFGQRRFVGATILLVIGLAALHQQLSQGWSRRTVVAVAVVTIWWNIGLTALFGAGMMDRQRLTLRQNAYDVFITLPTQAPGLAYRYLFHRESFYKSR